MSSARNLPAAPLTPCREVVSRRDPIRPRSLLRAHVRLLTQNRSLPSHYVPTPTDRSGGCGFSRSRAPEATAGWNTLGAVAPGVASPSTTVFVAPAGLPDATETGHEDVPHHAPRPAPSKRHSVVQGACLPGRSAGGGCTGGRPYRERAALRSLPTRNECGNSARKGCAYQWLA